MESSEVEVEPIHPEREHSPDQIREYVSDLVRSMRYEAHEKMRFGEDGVVDPNYCESTDDSPMKQLYGDKWTFIFGIQSGMDAMKEGSEAIRESLDGDPAYIKTTVGWKVDDSKWQENYEEFGYGTYGKGMKLGKRLAFYEGKSFEFTEGSNKESEEDSKFTFHS